MLRESELNELKTGDIVLIKFHPGFGSEFQKYRPAVIVSQQTTQIDNRFCLIAPFTTNLKILHKQTELLIKNNPALEKNSLLLCWYLWTIDTGRVVKKLGTLSQKDVARMKRAVLGLIS